MKRKREESSGGVLKKANICRFEDCTTRSTYGYVDGDDKRATRCKRHQLPDMIDVKNKRCQQSGCDKQPSFAKHGETIAVFCKEHKLPDMIDVVSKRCKQSGCIKHPTFAKPGENIPAFCKEHQLPDMIDVISRRCQESGCIKQPSFAKHGEKIPVFCKEHQLPDMIDVISRRCQESGCIKRPSFAKHGETIAVFCKEHQLPDMIDVRSKRCQQSGCDKIPSFAKHGEKIPAYCADHMVRGEMVDVKHKHCQKPGCDKIPSFAKHGETIPAFCKEHQLPEMVDVVNKRCQQSGCTTRASYGYLTFPPERCAQCAQHEKEMVANPTARCIIKGCREFATSGKASKRQHCSDHAQPGEISFAKQLCIGPNKTGCYEMAMLSPKSQLCVGCDPNYSMVKHVKMEENAVRSLLVHNGYKHFVYDRALPDNCGMTYRPDFLFQEPGFFVILEVDEHQHKSYKCPGLCICDKTPLCECEYKRMREITFINTIPTLFIRFNPHKYKTKGSMKSIAARHDELLRVLKQSLIDGPKARCEVKYLFYDESIEANQIVVATE
jgi:hypothetical protein